MECNIRHVQAEDEKQWRELWDGYTRFYLRESNEKSPAIRGNAFSIRRHRCRRSWRKAKDAG